MRRYFGQRVIDARQNWRVVPLEISFRSTEPVLQAIDAIFRHPAAHDGVALEGSEIRHVAARAGHAGYSSSSSTQSVARATAFALLRISFPIPSVC